MDQRPKQTPVERVETATAQIASKATRTPEDAASLAEAQKAVGGGEKAADALPGRFVLDKGPYQDGSGEG